MTDIDNTEHILFTYDEDNNIIVSLNLPHEDTELNRSRAALLLNYISSAQCFISLRDALVKWSIENNYKDYGTGIVSKWMILQNQAAVPSKKTYVKPTKVLRQTNN